MELTGLHVPTPEADVRVRDRSIVVAAPTDSLDHIRTAEVKPPSPAAAAVTVEMPGETAQTTARREVIGPEPPPVMPTQPPRVTLVLPPTSEPQPTGWKAWLPVIALGIVAIVAGVVAALWQ
jgi:hypothetical protein